MFRLGQRVKKVRGTQAIGVEGRVEGFHSIGTEYDGQVRIDDDIVVGDIVYLAGTVLDVKLDQWEPIIPSGYEPIPWSKCLWNPDMIEEKEKVAI